MHNQIHISIIIPNPMIIGPIVSQNRCGQLHVLQKERIIIIVIIRSNGAKTINLKNLIILMTYQKCVCIRCLNSMNIFDFSSVHQNNFLGVGSNFQFISIYAHYQSMCITSKHQSNFSAISWYLSTGCLVLYTYINYFSYKV